MAQNKKPVGAPPAVLNYAVPVRVAGRYTLVAGVALLLALLSGMCVLLMIAWVDFHFGRMLLWSSMLLFASVFAATAGVTVWLMVLMLRLGAAYALLELIAALGLVLLALVVIVQSPAMVIVGIGCLALSALRYLPHYGTLSVWCIALKHRKLAVNLQLLGYGRAMYELGWFGSTFAWGVSEMLHWDSGLETIVYYGLYGYMGIWIWMIVSHVRLLQLLKRR